MAKEHGVDVLVVGAGPVGLWTALLLSENGVRVRIIDKEEQPAARSYACALHPRSLKLLDRVGLASEVIESGRRVETVGFYEGPSRQAEVRLSQLATDFPFLLVLPQSRLEELLEERLRTRHGVEVGWNHRLADVHSSPQTVTAFVHKLGYACTGYLVSELERLVAKRLRIDAAFVAGTDGHGSLVRQSLDIPYDAMGGPEYFAVREVTVDGTVAPELRVILDDAGTSVCWPLAENRCRWSCQLSLADQREGHEPKERTAVLQEQDALDRQSIEGLQTLLQKRAPWFTASILEIDWSATVQFEKRLAGRFGQDRCWLAGDAAHQTGPVGVQSMNLGLDEATMLADQFTAILRGQAGLDSLAQYQHDRHQVWQQMLSGALHPTQTASPWIRQRAGRILPCLPAGGTDLIALAAQLGLAFGEEAQAPKTPVGRTLTPAPSRAGSSP